MRFDGLWLTSDESRTECVKTWSSYDNGRQLVPGSALAREPSPRP